MNVLSKVPAFSSVSCSQSSSLSNASPRRFRDHGQPRWGCPSKLIDLFQELLEANRIVQKQPAQQCFEAGGLAIDRGITSAGTATGPIATAAYELLLLSLKKRLKSQEELRLSIGSHLRYNSPMQVIGTAWVLAMLQALVQLPDGITEPGQLQRAKISCFHSGTLSRNPVAQAAN